MLLPFASNPCPVTRTGAFPSRCQATNCAAARLLISFEKHRCTGATACRGQLVPAYMVVNQANSLHPSFDCDFLPSKNSPSSFDCTPTIPRFGSSNFIVSQTDDYRPNCTAACPTSPRRSPSLAHRVPVTTATARNRRSPYLQERRGAPATPINPTNSHRQLSGSGVRFYSHICWDIEAVAYANQPRSRQSLDHEPRH